MSIGPELGQHILQTHNSKKNSEDSVGVEPPNPLPLGTPVFLTLSCK